MRARLTELLYNPQAAHRAYLDWQTIKPMVDAHFEGQASWQHLVAALTVFEIANNLWIRA
jgi:hypothetical protein